MVEPADNELHMVGFANLYHGEVYGECLCGWSTTAEPDEPLRDVIDQVRGRVLTHIREREAAQRAASPSGPDSSAAPA